MALLQQALQEALDGSIPKTASPLATAPCTAAEGLLAWIATEGNSVRAELFTTSVMELLDSQRPFGKSCFLTILIYNI